jgi:hypothetical protein
MKSEKYKHLEPFFGTLHLEEYSQTDLLYNVKKLLTVLFEINFEKGDFKSKFNRNDQLGKLLDLLEIVQFGKDKFPYLIALDFNPDSNDLTSISIWDDPHYSQGKELPSAFIGDLPSFPDLFLFKNKPFIFFNAIKSLRHKQDETNIEKLWKDVQNDPSLLIESDLPINMEDLKKNANISRIRRENMFERMIHHRVCIGGTKESALVIGSPRKEYFQDKQPIFQMRRK